VDRVEGHSDTADRARVPRTSQRAVNRATVVACLALFTDLLVYGIAIPVLPLLPSVVSAGPSATGALFAGYAAATLVITPVAGRLVDRFGPSRPLLVALVVLAAASALFTVGDTYPVLLLARVVQGAAAGLGWVSGLALIAVTTAPSARGKAMGLALSMVSVGVLVGPPLAGLLVQRLTVHAPFEFAAALALVVALIALIAAPRAGGTGGLPGGTRAVLRSPGVVPVLAVVVIAAGTLASVEPVLPLRLTLGFGMDALTVGLLFAAVVLASATVTPLAGGLVGRMDSRLLCAVGAAAAAAGLIMLGIASSLWQVWVGAVLLGVGEGVLLASSTALMGLLVGETTLGAGYALYNLAYAGGLMIGPLAAGSGTGSIGFRSTLVTLGAVTVLVAVLTLPRLPAARSAVSGADTSAEDGAGTAADGTAAEGGTDSAYGP
jgi:MFS family permease